MSRVAITTTAERGRDLVPLAEDYGLKPILLPCIEVTPASNDLSERARNAAERADWIVVTSPRSVTSLWPQGGMPDVTVAAVGRRTAEAVEQAGGNVGKMGEGGVIDLIAGMDLSGASVAFFHGSLTDRATVTAMEKVGATVTAVPVYQTRSIPPGPDPVEAAVFGSPSALAGWLLSRHLDGLVVAAIGRTTALALERHGAEVGLMPPVPTYDELIPLLAEHLKRSLV